MTLVLQGVAKTAGKDVHLAGIDLTFEKGPLNVLLGPTLAGKTSLMRVMAGLDRPTAGQVLVDGRDVTGRSVRRRNVAMVYRQSVNYPSMSVYDNIAAPLRRRRLAKKEIDRKVRETAEMMRIDRLLGRLPAALSDGQQQCTAIARALVKDADLLLLDEPLVNLDYTLREALRPALRDVFKQRDAIVVYATTEPLEALLLGGRTVVMDEGRVLQAGRAVEVYDTPASVRVGLIVSDPPMNLIDGVVADDEALLGGDIRVPLAGHLKGLTAGPYRFGVRANHLSVARRTRNDVPIAASVERAKIGGSETFIHVRHNDVSWVVKEGGAHGLASGESVSVFLDPGRLFAFGEDGGLAAAPETRFTGLAGGRMAT